MHLKSLNFIPNLRSPCVSLQPIIRNQLLDIPLFPHPLLTFPLSLFQGAGGVTCPANSPAPFPFYLPLYFLLIYPLTSILLSYVTNPLFNPFLPFPFIYPNLMMHNPLHLVSLSLNSPLPPLLHLVPETVFKLIGQAFKFYFWLNFYYVVRKHINMIIHNPHFLNDTLHCMHCYRQNVGFQMSDINLSMC